MTVPLGHLTSEVWVLPELALLELVRLRRARAVQKETYGEIWLERQESSEGAGTVAAESSLAGTEETA